MKVFISVSRVFLQHAYQKYFIFALMIFCEAFSAPVFAWSADSSVNTLISGAANAQYFAHIVEDGAGGTIIAWRDTRSGRAELFAQRLNAQGEPQWNQNGVRITASSTQEYRLISDQSGGAILAWHETRDGVYWDVYAQRINSNGVVQWASNGAAISTADHNQLTVDLIGDDSGGAIICWVDHRETDPGIYAQRISGNGAVQWAENGVVISTTGEEHGNAQITRDEHGGAIISWEDKRNSAASDIYAQRIDADGVVQWAINGVAISVGGINDAYQKIVSDDSGGAIIVWGDYRTTDWDIYAQRVNAAGVVQWAENGIVITAAAFHQLPPEIVADGAGGAVVVWLDGRSGESSRDVYAQRVNTSGAVQWTANGVFIANTGHASSDPDISVDSEGNTVIVWVDKRDGVDRNIYAQRLNGDGSLQWPAVGVPVSVAAGDQVQAAIHTRSNGSSIMVWTDTRNYAGSNYDVYAQQLSANGELGRVEAVVDEGFCFPVRAGNGKIALVCL